MTIASTTSKLLYNGDGATTVFAISFVFWQSADIKVVHRDANGAETTWVEGTQYTITGGAGSTGTLTVETTPTDYTPALGEKLLIKSAVPELQQAALPLGGAFPSTTVEQMVDIVTRLVQQNSEKHERAIRIPEADPAAPLVELPPQAARANKIIGFDSSSQLIAVEPTDGSAVAVTAAGSTTSRLLADRFADLINVKDYGAVGDGVTDDDAARVAAQSAMSQNQILFFPGPNTYKMGADLPTGPFLWLNKGFAGGVSPGASAVNTALLVTAETADTSPLDPIEARTGISITVQANGAHHASGIRSNLINYSTDGNGCTAMYARASSLPGSNWAAAAHGETRHDGGTSIAGSFEAASYSTLGSFFGIVVNNTTTGADPTHPISGAAKAAHPVAIGIYVQGDNDTDPQGGWVYGLRFATKAMRAGGSTIRIDSTAAVAKHFETLAVAAAATADIHLQGNSGTGIILQGAYTSGNAIRVPADQAIAFENTGAIRLRYNAGGTRLEIANGSTERLGFVTTASPAIRVAGSQVVAARKTGWATATGTATRTTFNTATVTTAQLAQRVKALIDDLHAASGHGLIGV